MRCSAAESGGCGRLAEPADLEERWRQGRDVGTSRLVIVVFLALMGLLAARYVHLEHDPRRAEAVQSSIARTFLADGTGTSVVQDRESEQRAAAMLRRSGTTAHEPGEVEAELALGEPGLAFQPSALFEPNTARIREEARIRIGRLASRVLPRSHLRLEVVLAEEDLRDPGTLERLGHLMAYLRSLGVPAERIAFGSGGDPGATWLIRAGRTGPW